MNNSMEMSQVGSSILRLCSRLIFDSNSPFYCELGYVVVQTCHNSAQLLSIGSVGPDYLGKDAHLTSLSEIGGIPLRVPINALIDIGDMLYLLSVFWSPGNLPLVTSFLYQDCSMYRLRVAITLTYVEGQLTYLSELANPHEEPIKETLTVNLPSEGFHRYRTMFFRERCFLGIWWPIRMQLTAVSPVVPLTALEFVPDKGVFCRGPVDPWNYAAGVVSSLHAIYWIPCTVYNCVPHSHVKRFMLRLPLVRRGPLAHWNILFGSLSTK